jgi:membrane protein
MKSKIIAYLNTDMWRIRLGDLPLKKSFFIKQIRIFVLTIREFKADKCLLRASALTFYSILSIGPVVALALGIAKGFGLEKMLERQVLDKLPAQEAVLSQILQYARILLENTKGGVIVGIGIIILFWAVLRVFNHIERAFNDIWQIKKTRMWRRKLSNYLAFILLAPILLMMYSSIPVFITSQLGLIAERIVIFQKISPLIFFLLKLFPYFLIWGLFTFIYVLIPNTRVNFISGLLAGIIAGTIYLLVQWGYIIFQIGVTRYNPIYGSLAALPLLLLWLHLGWVILLFGAEYSYAHQNVDSYEFEPDYLKISPYFKKLLTLQIVHLMLKKFSSGEAPLNAVNISQKLEIPIRLVHQILEDLEECGLVTNIKPDDYEESIYQPASDIGAWTIKYVMDALERRGVNQLPVAQTQELNALSEKLRELGETIEMSPANILIKDI